MGDSAICWRAAAAAGGGGCGGGCDIAGAKVVGLTTKKAKVWIAGVVITNLRKFGHGWMEYAMLVDRDFFVDFLSGAGEAWR